jgi:hypothetical protein
MNESQQKVLGLLPKMGERFPKYFGSESGQKQFVVILGGVMFGIGNVTTLFVAAPALIIEACRLIALEASCQLLDHGHCFECWHSVQREITPEFGYDPQDPFARAAAAMECVLSLPEGG